MIQSPKSLTATIHVRFHYENPDGKLAATADTETIHRILDQAADMEPDLQEILVRFANYLNNQGDGKKEAQSPG